MRRLARGTTRSRSSRTPVPAPASGPELAGETPAFLAEIGRERRSPSKSLGGLACDLLPGPRVVHREHVDVEGHAVGFWPRRSGSEGDGLIWRWTAFRRRGG